MTKVLIAFADTGGGHRAAANAIRDALHRHSASVDVTMVDPYAMSDRWPFDRLSAAYPRVVDNASWLWRGGFALTNSSSCTYTLQTLAWPALRATFRGIREQITPDVIVSTHPLLTTPLRRVFPNTPIVVVVTDLVSGHVSWYNRRADLLIAPTSVARARAIECGLAPSTVEELGLPLPPGCERTAHDAWLPERLGWSTLRPTVLLVGGGDGVGPLERNAVAIDAAQLPCDVAVVCGRNSALAKRLREREWCGTVHVYEFVHNLNEMMRAAHAVVTKAGPGTIAEAFAAACPLVLTGAIPGQESGNVEYVTKSGAGVWAPTASAVVDALRSWLQGSEGALLHAAAVSAAVEMARPHASAQIAARVLASCHKWRPRTRLTNGPLLRGIRSVGARLAPAQ
jgi:1,2-diacylglycerol 3-beta-galactosyltransferase